METAILNGAINMLHNFVLWMVLTHCNYQLTTSCIFINYHVGQSLWTNAVFSSLNDNVRVINWAFPYTLFFISNRVAKGSGLILGQNRRAIQNIHFAAKINIGNESYQSQKQFKSIILGRGWMNFQISVLRNSRVDPKNGVAYEKDRTRRAQEIAVLASSVDIYNNLASVKI